MENGAGNSGLMLFGLDGSERSLRGVAFFLSYFILSVLAASLLTVPLYRLVECVDFYIIPLTDGYIRENLERLSSYLLGKNLNVYFKRAYMFSLLVGLPVIMKCFKTSSLKTLGFDFSGKNIAAAGKLCALGVLVIGICALCQIFFGNSELKVRTPNFAFKLSTTIISAFLVAFFEEAVFRGIVFRLFYTAWRGMAAIILSSLFYAYMHFGTVIPFVPNGCTEIGTGFEIGFGAVFGIACKFSAVKFFVLFFLGTAIGQIYLRRKTLIPCVGFHGGIVFMMLMYKSFFRVENPDLFWGGSSFTDGIFPLLTVILINIAIYFSQKRRGRAS